jgi:hypothetical protein
MRQELNLIERDPNYVNPYKVNLVCYFYFLIYFEKIKPIQTNLE